MIAPASRASFPPCVESGVESGLREGPLRCPCALRVLDYCLAKARYMKTDDCDAPKVYWEDRDGCASISSTA